MTQIVADTAPAADPVPCPMCDYDLRGQPEPRCPECGYRFEWPELTDPDLKRHPYLFEHHPRRNVWSFFRTMAGGLRPRRFWSSLRPSQPSRPLRLVLYWLVASLLVPIGYAGVFAHTCYRYAPDNDRERASLLVAYTGYYRRFAPSGRPPPNTNGAPTAQAYVDTLRPPTWTPSYVAYVYRLFYDKEFDQHLDAVLVYLAWPGLTLATLMIFRASMRRAKVKPVHVLRCTLYCCDAAPWLLAVALLAVPPLIHHFDLRRYIGHRDAVVSAVLFAAVTAVRLMAAYRHYLRFDHPAATAAASQAIVLLSAWLYLLVRALET
jgi:hypothetical protein